MIRRRTFLGGGLALAGLGLAAGQASATGLVLDTSRLNQLSVDAVGALSPQGLAAVTGQLPHGLRGRLHPGRRLRPALPQARHGL